MSVYAEYVPTRWLPVGAAFAAVVLGAMAGYNPKLALVATFGLIFVVVATTSLTAGICLFAAFTYVEEVIPSGGLPVTKVFGALLVVSWFAAITVGDLRNRKLFPHHGFLFLLVVFVCWAGVSAIWAEYPAKSLETVTRYAPNAMLFVIVYSGCRSRTDVMWVIGALVIGTLISAAYGLAVQTDPAAEGRLSGALGNANETGAVLAIGVALAAGLALALRGKPWLRLAALAAVPMCLIALFLTDSRGGLLALGAVLAAGLLLARHARGKALIATVVAVLGVVLYVTTFATPQAREHLLNESGGGTGRTDIWTVGWRMVEANPVVGIGSGNYSSSSVHYLLQPGVIRRDDFIVDTPKVAHNTYLQVLAELGVVGLVLFLAILVYVVLSGLKAVRRFAEAGDREMEMIARAVLVAIAGLFMACVFGSREYSNQFWLLLSLAPALLGVAASELAAAQRARDEEPAAGAPPLSAPVA